MTDSQNAPYWSRPAADLMTDLGSSAMGLDPATAGARLVQHGPNALAADRLNYRVVRLFFDRFRSPLVLILIFAAIVSLAVRDNVDAAIILAIVLVSAALSFVQEYRAGRAVERLKERVAVKARVLRGGQLTTVRTEEIVPGDVVKLAAGSLVPADGVVLEASDLFVSQALLTGETLAVEKRPGAAAADAGLPEQTGCVFMGTSVRSGTATVLIVRTGPSTHYGEIARTLELRRPETGFERGLRQFGTLLVRIMLIIVVAVLAINTMAGESSMEMVLFAMALAVGLSPELLPAILTITLARGARNMVAHGVIVKRLNSIENLGSMNVLCSDKTGTLTRGVMQLDNALDANGEASREVLQLAYLNAALQTGLDNPLDQALATAGEAAAIGIAEQVKLAEVPYDFTRKRLSVLVTGETAGTSRMITKGALDSVLDICDRVADGAADKPLDADRLAEIHLRFVEWGRQGYRVLGVAEKVLPGARRIVREDEHEMVFMGFLLFFDPPEPRVRTTIGRLHRLGVRVKVITGDNRFVARHVAEAVGIQAHRVITGAEIAAMNDEALWHLAPRTNLFAEVDPNQKERIIRAIQKSGAVVGYLGDGINDAPALHAADVGISVDQAVDVAKEAADIVLLEHDLEVLRAGIDEGRHTFANTIKYIYITTSANFGNMISMAVATLYLPFLPLLAKQILLNNFLSDVPAVGIASDNVDRDWERTPHRWDIKLVRNFMITFGLVSTVFDLLTFAVLLELAGTAAEIFRTGWFVESVLTELLIVFIIRTYQPFWRSRPGRTLAWTTVGVILATLLLPYLPFADLFGFVPLSLPLLSAIVAIALAYALVSELTKRVFFRHVGRGGYR
jgi:Mg2+-importing ATPase